MSSSSGRRRDVIRMVERIGLSSLRFWALNSVPTSLRRLKASDEPPLHLWGSSELLQMLIAADLLDEYRLWVFPVELGQ